MDMGSSSSHYIYYRLWVVTSMVYDRVDCNTRTFYAIPVQFLHNLKKYDASAIPF